LAGAWYPPPFPGRGLAVSDRCRGNCLDRRPRLPHLPGSPLPDDGRDPALCALDHVRRLTGTDDPQSSSTIYCTSFAFAM